MKRGTPIDPTLASYSGEHAESLPPHAPIYHLYSCLLCSVSVVFANNHYLTK